MTPNNPFRTTTDGFVGGRVRAHTRTRTRADTLCHHPVRGRPDRPGGRAGRPFVTPRLTESLCVANCASLRGLFLSTATACSKFLYDN